MKAKNISLVFAVEAMTFAAGATANEIYKWTDEDGNVLYEDRPRGSTSEERLTLTYARTDNSAVSDRVQARQERQTAREEAKSQAAAAEQEAADNAAAAAERAQACERHQRHQGERDETVAKAEVDQASDHGSLRDAPRVNSQGSTRTRVASWEV